LQIDEPVIYFYFQRWQMERDPILRDLCSRFINRNLFKYVEFDPKKDAGKFAELQQLLEQAGLDPTYYLVIDSTSDLPYDVYRPGEERVPIYLQMPSLELTELSRHSGTVEEIRGDTRAEQRVH